MRFDGYRLWCISLVIMCINLLRENNRNLRDETNRDHQIDTYKNQINKI